MSFNPQTLPPEGGLLKYVRFADGTVLFADACRAYGPTHKCLLKDHPTAPPFSAGHINIKGKRWFISDGWSTSLNIGRKTSDEKYIQKALGTDFTHDENLYYEALYGSDWMKECQPTEEKTDAPQ